MQNTARSRFFWRFGISRLLITPIGSKAMAVSLAMFKPAFQYLSQISSVFSPSLLALAGRTHQTINRFMQ